MKGWILLHFENSRSTALLLETYRAREHRVDLDRPKDCLAEIRGDRSPGYIWEEITGILEPLVGRNGHGH